MNEKQNPQPRRLAHKTLLTLLLIGTVVVFIRHRTAPGQVDAYLAELGGESQQEMCSVSTIGFTRVAPGETLLVKRLLARPTPTAGEEVRVVVGLSTPNGRPISPEELRETHTEKFHLLIVDPTLEDYHHVHPDPTIVPGEYVFTFTPQRSGTYRMFGDLLLHRIDRYAHTVADLEVSGSGGTRAKVIGKEVADGSYRFSLVEPAGGILAGEAVYIGLDIRHVTDGEEVALQPVMGAYSHVVVFNEGRSGFLHMHPQQELNVPIDPVSPRLLFTFRAAEAGEYTAWAQVKLDGQERLLPFRLSVQ